MDVISYVAKFMEIDLSTSEQFWSCSHLWFMVYAHT